MTRMETQASLSTPTASRLAFSLAESEALSGLSRSSLYRLIGSGELQSVKVRNRRLIPVAALERLCGVHSTIHRSPNDA